MDRIGGIGPRFVGFLRVNILDTFFFSRYAREPLKFGVRRIQGRGRGYPPFTGIVVSCFFCSACQRKWLPSSTKGPMFSVALKDGANPREQPMERDNEIHIPDNRRDERSMREIGRKALAALQQVIREEAGAVGDPRDVCLGCSAIVAEAAAEAAEAEFRTRALPPMAVESFLRSLLGREAVRV